MNVAREQVAVAFYNLFNPALLQNACSGSSGPFRAITRVWDVPQQAFGADQLPALFCVEDNENDTEANLPNGVWNQQVYVLKWRLAVFASMPSADSGIVPMSVLNPLLDAIDGTQGDGGMRAGTLPGQTQTLGGLVQNVFIDGNVIKGAGYLGQYVVGIIPVSIYTGI